MCIKSRKVHVYKRPNTYFIVNSIYKGETPCDWITPKASYFPIKGVYIVLGQGRHCLHEICRLSLGIGAAREMVATNRFTGIHGLLIVICGLGVHVKAIVSPRHLGKHYRFTSVLPFTLPPRDILSSNRSHYFPFF